MRIWHRTTGHRDFVFELLGQETNCSKLTQVAWPRLDEGSLPLNAFQQLPKPQGELFAFVLAEERLQIIGDLDSRLLVANHDEHIVAEHRVCRRW